ncbi:MAG: hypothetical protein IAX21_04050 [Candidatus Bathyarchaeota archaeon]|nr:MAG: hypothetical protein IAX21_04050 [Candidatus Bathyarchaeota archaeon]
MPQGVVKPSNQIVAYGDPLMVEMEIGANATAADMLAGRVVIFDDADQTVKESGAAAANVVGFLEVDPAKTKITAYAVGDQAKVVIGECLAVLTLLANEAVTRGDALVTAANGKLAKQAVGAMGAQGQVVAYAWESSNVAQDAEILVHWKPSGEPAAAA